MDPFQPLTIRIKPYKDEAISSFMFRLAQANGISMLSLWKLVREERNHFVQRADIRIIDFAPVNVINAEKLAKVAMANVETVLKGSLYYLLDKFSQGESLERARFLSGVIRDYVVYCPICLYEHRYYPIYWRIDGLDVCLKHRTKLLTSCFTCNRTIEYKDVSSIGECPHCYEDLGTIRPVNQVQESEYLSQKTLYNLWIQLLEPSSQKLTPSEVAIRILYLSNHQNQIPDMNRIKENISNKSVLSTILQQARGTLSANRVIHIKLVLKFLELFRIDVKGFFDIEVPKVFINQIKYPLKDMKNQYSCLAPWCINYNKRGGLVKTGTSLKKRMDGKTLHYYLSCPECSCEYAINQSGQLEERTYFIEGYHSLKELFNIEFDLSVLAEKSGLSEDRVRRCYAYFRTRGLLNAGNDNFLEGWANKQIQIDNGLLNKVIHSVRDCINLKVIEKWELWNSYDQFLTYRFQQDVMRALIEQKRVRPKRGSKVNFENVRLVLNQFIESDVEISIGKVAQVLQVSPETLRRIEANPLIDKFKANQREKKLTSNAMHYYQLADRFFELNQYKKIAASELYDYLGIHRAVLWRTNPEITKKLGLRLRDHNISLKGIG